MRKPLHIVCLDSPSPANYGGAIDMYYKIQELSRYRDIILHFFNYKKGRSAEGLEPYCHAIYSYPRASFLHSLFRFQPYIVSSRLNDDLINRLNKDDHPVLLEGIHCTGIIPYLRANRHTVIRMHNDEAEYYKNLAWAERNLIKKTYFFFESVVLKTYQQRLKKSLPLAFLSSADLDRFRTRYEFQNLHLIPPFCSWQELKSLEGFGSYCLYHGNLEIAENRKVAIWLIQNVFSQLKISFYVAGKGVNNRLKALANKHLNVCLINDPSPQEMDELILHAHINVLPSFNTTGLKLKILHALFYGRFCLANDAAIAGTAFDGAVEVANDPDKYITQIKRLIQLPFSKENLRARQKIATVYNNGANAERLNALL